MSVESAPERRGRRLFILRLAALPATAAGLAGCSPEGLQTASMAMNAFASGMAAGSGARPVFPAAGRTGLTDADPSDGVGQGRGSGYRSFGASSRTGLTDADPSDGVGQGRGSGYRPYGTPIRTGLTDADPRDPVRGGRG